MTGPTLFERLRVPDDGEAINVAGERLSYLELAGASAAIGSALEGAGRVAVWASPSRETIVALVGALRVGATVVPINPGARTLELEHIMSDSRPGAIVAAVDVDLPPPLIGLPRIAPRLTAVGGWNEPVVEPSRAAIIFYTSGTTDVPKGVPVSRAAIVSNLDALAQAWAWTGADRLVHALPLFHVHGLVLGVLGPLHLGGQLEHLGRFSPDAIAAAFERGATMLFGVPTMYGRLADAAERDPRLVRGLAGARLLVSGSAGLPAALHQRIEAICGQRIVERYGMTETLMITAMRADGQRAPGYVGTPIPGVEVRLVDDHGDVVTAADDGTFGEVAVRSPSLFGGYLNRDEATAEAFRDGWFLTGDLAARAPNGYLRIVGRRSTDIIKSGGYKIGALEIESVLLSHPAVSEVAVAGVPDEDLGERVTAWVVPRVAGEVTADELIAHTRESVSRHKRVREVRLVERLPRNAMGKVLKRELTADAAARTAPPARSPT